MDMDIPEITLRAGERVTHTFRFARPSRLMGVQLASEGIRVESISFLGRDFAPEDFQEFNRYRILPTNDVQIKFLNESEDDAIVIGTLKLQDNPVPRQGQTQSPPQGTVHAAPPPEVRSTPEGRKLGPNDVCLIISRGQAEKLLRLVKGEFVSPYERTELIEPLRAATV